MKQQLLDTLSDITGGLHKTAGECGEDGHYCEICDKMNEGMACDCGESCGCAMQKEAEEHLEVTPLMSSLALALHKRAKDADTVNTPPPGYGQKYSEKAGSAAVTTPKAQPVQKVTPEQRRANIAKALKLKASREAQTATSK